MISRRIVVIGSNGQLGSDLVSAAGSAGHEVIPLTHADIDVADARSVADTLRSACPAVIFNTAAFHHVPKCEVHPTQAYTVNAVGALNIARIAEEVGAVNVFFSTDYVFDGAKRSPYIESDNPNPLNVYAGTKLLGEFATLNNCSRGYVFRISGIYGSVPCRAKGGNFISNIVRTSREKPEVRVVQDEILTPTPTTEIAAHALAVVDQGTPGLYHLTSEGQCSWYEFASVIFSTLEIKTPLHPAVVSDFPSSVRRPLYSVLENSTLKRQGMESLPYWKESLVGFLRRHYLKES